MTNRDLIIASGIAIALIAAFAFATAPQVPAGEQLPIHWNAAGQPDDWAHPLVALLIPAGILAFTTALFAIVPSLEPLQDKLEGSAPLLRAAWIGLIFISLLLALVTGLPAWGIAMPGNAILLGVGMLFLLLGNALPKSRPGFFVGIRTPWAITDTDNWIATHRLGGKLFMLTGLLMCALSFLPLSEGLVAGSVLVIVVMTVVVPFAYSWWLWRSQRKI